MDELQELVDESRMKKAMKPVIYDWRKHTCGECGYWADRLESQGSPIAGCRKFGIKQTKQDSACPDFQPREVPDD